MQPEIKRNKTIRQKLLMNSIFMILVSFSLVIIFVYFAFNKISNQFIELNENSGKTIDTSLTKLSENNIKTINDIYQDSLQKKGYSLLQKDSSSVITMFEDNSFSTLRDFLKEYLKSDSDILLASFSTEENKKHQAWQVVTRTYSEGLNLPIEYDSQKKSWLSSYEDNAHLEVIDNDVENFSAINKLAVEFKDFTFITKEGLKKTIKAYVCIIPIYKKDSTEDDILQARKSGKTIGYLRYVLSPAGMEKAIDDQKKSIETILNSLTIANQKISNESKAIANSSVQQIYLLSIFGIGLVILIAYFMSARSSEKVTRPIKELTLLAERMAAGEYKHDINIKSDDEIGILADTFQRMSLAIIKRDEDLAEINRNLEKLVEERTGQLKEQLTLTSNLLNNMKQAVFSIDDQGTVVVPVSKYSEKLFGKSIAGESIYDLLFKDMDKKSEDFSQVNNALISIFGEEEHQWIFSESFLPKNIIVNLNNEPRILKVNYNPFWSSDSTLEKLMLIVEDITDITLLEEKIKTEKAENNKRIHMIQELAHVDIDKLESYFTHSHVMIEELNTLSISNATQPLNVELIKRNIHTLKGNSRLYGFTLASNQIHKIEDETFQLLEKFKLNELDFLSFNEQYSLHVNQIKNAVNEYNDLAQKIFKIQKSQQNIHESLKTTKVNSLVLKQLKDTLMNNLSPQFKDQENIISMLNNLSSVSLKSVFENYSMMVKDLADQFSKDIVFNIEGDEILIPEAKAAKLNDAIGHIIRNSIDHGIETPEVRIKAGKNSEGNIKTFWQEDSKGLTIEISDDGNGIDGEKLYQKYLKQGKDQIATADLKQITELEKINLIFLPGLTTKENKTNISGAGVGMDAVKGIINDLGGTISVSTQRGVQTKFTIYIPFIGDKFTSALAS